jgi:FKBP-type peptidyl-prolyl cis-trans isomerase
MQITFVAVNLLAAGMLLGNALAQTPAATTPPAAPAKTAQAPAAKKTTTAKSPAPALTLKTPKEKFSYALGMSMGQNMHKQSVPVDASILARGLRDGLAGGKTLMTDDEAKAAIMQVQTEMRQKQQEKIQQEGASNKKQGEEFLAANKAKEGVVALPSGLQYKILKEGAGPKPAASDTVACNYRGTFIDGREFDSSYKQGKPVSFPVSGVIKGWTEALQLMPVGSKWQLFIPSDLAYGDQGRPGIDPAATLVFEVELLSIQPKDDKGQDKK